ncbi:MAG: hypothetical protein AB7V77_03540 [Candidatus Woesearchaeota archaeon]
MELICEERNRKDKKIIAEIDSTLTFKSKFLPSSFSVSKVEKEKQFYVFKAIQPKYRSNFEYRKEIINEIKSLKFAHGIQGVNSLIQTYYDGKFPLAFLKDFHEGKTLFELDRYINNTTIQSKLQNMIKELHSVGICNFKDLFKRNIIISPCGKNFYLIDLAQVSFRDEISHIKFEVYKNRDYINLEQNIFK